MLTIPGHVESQRNQVKAHASYFIPLPFTYTLGAHWGDGVEEAIGPVHSPLPPPTLTERPWIWGVLRQAQHWVTMPMFTHPRRPRFLYYELHKGKLAFFLHQCLALLQKFWVSVPAGTSLGKLLPHSPSSSHALPVGEQGSEGPLSQASLDPEPLQRSLIYSFTHCTPKLHQGFPAACRCRKSDSPPPRQHGWHLHPSPWHLAKRLIGEKLESCLTIPSPVYKVSVWEQQNNPEKNLVTACDPNPAAHYQHFNLLQDEVLTGPDLQHPQHTQPGSLLHCSCNAHMSTLTLDDGSTPNS